jgi:hypothetical protein
MSVSMLLNVYRIRIGGPKKVGCFPQCGWVSSNLLRAWMKQKAEEGGIFTFSGSLFELGHVTFTRPLTWVYITSSTVSQAFRCGLNYITCLARSVLCRQEIVEFFVLHNYMSQFLITIYTCICYMDQIHGCLESLGKMGRCKGQLSEEVFNECKNVTWRIVDDRY